ncbi:MAG: DUF6414 family protein [Ruminococcus sp.]|nr:DUF6414 family protein [Ruminococcus sp.]
MDSKMCKIVYFDEDSVTDYVQIFDGGELEMTTELLKDVKDSTAGNSQISGKIGIPKLLKAFLGSNLDVSAGASINVKNNNERIIKNIIKNTLLTDFINIVENNSADIGDSSEREKSMNENSPIICRFRGYKISAPKDSLSYISLISPYLSMFRGGDIPAGDFKIALERLDNTIKTAKGYYEFVGENISVSDEDKKKVIFRFNINSFKNNYKPTDLLKMNITVYAIHVGESSVDKLDVNNEFNISTYAQDNPSYTEGKEDLFNKDNNIDLKVYDVLLAGVESK